MYENLNGKVALVTGGGSGSAGQPLRPSPGSDAKS